MLTASGVRNMVASLDPVQQQKLREPQALANLVRDRPHDTLVHALRQAKQQQNAQNYLERLLGRTAIQINEIELAHLTNK